MKEEVYEKFASKALAYLENTEVFLKEQVPDYFRQLLTYYTIQYWVGFVVIFIFTVAAALFAYKQVKKEEYDKGFAAVLAVLLLLLPSGFTVITFSKALKVTLAPKVFIVDYLRGKE